MKTFAELVVSRKDWIETVLKPWCARAALTDLLNAEAEWINLAGHVDPEATLWVWAWSRFPDLVCEESSGVDETPEVQVTLKNGTTIIGYPDARKTCQGQLILLTRSAEQSTPYRESGPHSINDVVSAKRA